MMDAPRKRPTLRDETSSDEYAPDDMPDDTLTDAIMYERALLLRQEMVRVIVKDMETRTVDGKRAIDFCVTRVVREALARSYKTRRATEEDIDDEVMDEIEATAARVAHDLTLATPGAEAGNADEEEPEFAFVVDTARQCILRCATVILTSPIIAKFPCGARREVEAARSILTSPRTRKHSRLARALRGMPKQ